MCALAITYMYISFVADSNGDDLAGPKSKTSHTTGAGKKALPVTKGTYMCAYT